MASSLRFSHEHHVQIAYVRVDRDDVLGQRRGHQTAGTVRDGLLQKSRPDSHGDAPDDLAASRLRVQNPAAINGRHDSSDAHRRTAFVRRNSLTHNPIDEVVEVVCHG